jgi:hypothetical protein
LFPTGPAFEAAVAGHDQRVAALTGPSPAAASSGLALLVRNVQFSDDQHAVNAQAFHRRRDQLALQREQAAHQQAASSLQSSTSVVPMLEDLVPEEQTYPTIVRPVFNRVSLVQTVHP